jgi:hypothetical protein
LSSKQGDIRLRATITAKPEPTDAIARLTRACAALIEAGPTNAMTHLHVTGTEPDGKNVTWMEKVTDEQYKTR